ncbi:MAG: hypothetical protein PHC61_04520 [Chitinivibrionales bacterium]|nr:hypothetical protein [Chitinivibrionales bacterium]
MLDPQITEYIVFGIIGVLVLGSVILGIINWTRLFSVSSKITVLENEVEKKTLEFDNLKKSRRASPPQAASQSASNAPAKDDMESGDGNEIRIVRNMRAGVEEENGSYLQNEVVQMKHGAAPAQKPVPREPVQPELPPTPAPVLPPATEPAPENISSVILPPAPDPEPPAPAATAQPSFNRAAPQMQEAPPSTGDVMDVIETSEAPADMEKLDMDDCISIPLYSLSKKDADFEQAFNFFNATVPANPGTTIAIDFEHIMFMYEKELDYLEKMKTLAQQHRNNIVFVNCHAELKAVLQSRGDLGRFLGD